MNKTIGFFLIAGTIVFAWLIFRDDDSPKPKLSGSPQAVASPAAETSNEQQDSTDSDPEAESAEEGSEADSEAQESEASSTTDNPSETALVSPSEGENPPAAAPGESVPDPHYNPKSLPVNISYEAAAYAPELIEKLQGMYSGNFTNEKGELIDYEIEINGTLENPQKFTGHYRLALRKNGAYFSQTRGENDISGHARKSPDLPGVLFGDVDSNYILQLEFTSDNSNFEGRVYHRQGEKEVAFPTRGQRL